MHLVVRRYSRSGNGPPWFYFLMCAGFVAMAVWAFAQGDWLVGALAVAMVPLTIAGSRVMRRLATALRASRAVVESPKGEHR